MLEFVQIAIGGLVVGSIYAAIALGFSLIYRVTGAINLSQGGFALISAMIGYTFGVAWGWPLVVAIPAAVVTTVIIGVSLAAFTFVPALTRLSNANVLMLTAGILTMIEGFSLAVWGSQPYAMPPFSGEQPLAFGAILIPTQAFWVFGATALCIVALWFLIARTKLGKGLRACAENPSAASLMGIDVPRMTLLSFGLAILIAAISGVIVAPTTSLQFDTGRLFTISGFVAAAIGGIASFPGAVIGGLFLGLVTQLSTAYISSLFSSAISLLILLVVLIWRPQGLIAVRRRAAAGYPRRGEGRGPCGQAPGASCLAAGGDRGDRGRAHSFRHHRQRHHERARDCGHPVHDADGARRADGLRRAGQPWPGRLHGDRRLHVGLSRDQHRDRAGAVDPRRHRRLVLLARWCSRW